ncbi:MAG TPA: phytanoyl-CoA dioxygenase family protein [Allosphingosinicella sp.]|nr:phytanoyl-CoA dioxygenase family protein [Allosphingosinicella sp.]
MTEVMGEDQTIAARDVTEEERDFFHEHGWVKLPKLISEADAELLRSEAERLMISESGLSSNISRVGNQVDKGLRSHQMAQFHVYNEPSKVSEPFRRIYDSRSMGHVAARLMTNRWTGPRRARRLGNTLLVKGPQSSTGSSSTRWHQDRPYFPFDRERMIMLWIALAPVTPEMGSLRFIDRGNRFGEMGRYSHVETEDMVETFPGLAEHCGITPPFGLAPGDATAHDALTPHSAGPNFTDRIRWGHTLTYFPSDALYTGASHRSFDGLGLVVNEPFDHPNFPIVGEP